MAREELLGRRVGLWPGVSVAPDTCSEGDSRPSERSPLDVPPTWLLDEGPTLEKNRLTGSSTPFFYFFNVVPLYNTHKTPTPKLPAGGVPACAAAWSPLTREEVGAVGYLPTVCSPPVGSHLTVR